MEGTWKGEGREKWGEREGGREGYQVKAALVPLGTDMALLP